MAGEGYPKFAVVGHPNKGKSSIVSALAMDDSVQISDTPGTTTEKRSFPLKVDGKIVYELFDTPGFQRARRVLSWLEKYDVSADKKYEVVKQFIHVHSDDPKFQDEIELLKPIMAGAGIIYVVDGSKPYGEEYEAEMEILRWTGQPSMALINHIDDSDYSKDWKRALGHYFKIVRIFDPIDTGLAQHVSILESIAQLKEEWTDSVKASIVLVEKYHTQMLKRSSMLISQVILKSILWIERMTLRTEEATQNDRRVLEENYKEHLRHLEIRTQESIQKVWNHNALKAEKDKLTFETLDLFSRESASVFGLSRKELFLTAAASGAATGAGVDLLFAGSTLLLGASLGAVVGGVGSFFAFNELSEIRVLGQTLGKRSLEMGPMENENFPYILLGRSLYYTLQVVNRSHALRGTVNFKMDSSFKERWLNDTLRQELEVYHKKFRKEKTFVPDVVSDYEILIEHILIKLMTT